jgi:hypothetical protein
VPQRLFIVSLVHGENACPGEDAGPFSKERWARRVGKNIRKL